MTMVCISVNVLNFDANTTNVVCEQQLTSKCCQKIEANINLDSSSSSTKVKTIVGSFTQLRINE